LPLRGSRRFSRADKPRPDGRRSQLAHNSVSPL
jgi:hypothetical protein